MLSNYHQNIIRPWLFMLTIFIILTCPVLSSQNDLSEEECQICFFPMHTYRSIYDRLLSHFIYNPYCSIECNKHYCHHSCLLGWIQQHPTCPFCRRIYEPNEINQLESYKSPVGQKIYNFLRIIFIFIIRLMSYFGKILILLWNRINVKQLTTIMEQVYLGIILKPINKVKSTWESRVVLPVHSIFDPNQNMFEKIYKYKVLDPKHIHAISTEQKQKRKLQEGDVFTTMKNIHQYRKIRGQLSVVDEQEGQFLDITLEKTDAVKLQNYEYVIAKKQWEKAAKKLGIIEHQIVVPLWIAWYTFFLVLAVLDSWIFYGQRFIRDVIFLLLVITCIYFSDKVLTKFDDFLNHKKGWVWYYIYYKFKPVRIFNDIQWQLFNTRLTQ